MISLRWVKRIFACKSLNSVFLLFFTALMLSLGLFTPKAFAAFGAQACSAAFVDGLTNSSDEGSISFSDWGTLYNNPDAVLASNRVNNYSWYNDSCDSTECRAGGSGSLVPELQAQYQSYSSSQDVYLNRSNRTLTSNDYEYITVTRSSQLNFSGSHSSYHFRQLWIDGNSTVNLPAGDYYIDYLVVDSGGRINVSGNGTVRIFTKYQMQFGYDAVINGGSSGSPEKMFLYHFGEYDPTLWIYSGAKVSALIYSAEDVYVGGWFPSPWRSQVYGSIAARDDIRIVGTAEVYFDSTAAGLADFGSNCQQQGADIHHIVISHDGNASTCAAEAVTIKACADAFCGQLYSSPVSLDFTVGGSVKQSVTFTGQTTINFTHSDAETAALGMTNLSVSASDPLFCLYGFGSDCNMVFSDSGCSVNGNSCAATFPDGASNSSNSGWIYFTNSGYVQGSPDNVLHTTDLYQSGNGYPSCQSGYCSSNNEVVPAIVEQVLTTNSRTNFSVNSSGSSVISNNEFKNVSVTGGHGLTMNSLYDTYRFNRLSIGRNSTVYLTEGDYHIKNLYIDGGFLKVHSSVTGTVRVYVSNELYIYNGARVNDDVYGDPNKLYFYHHGKGRSQVYIDNAEVSGYFYSHKHITVTNRAVVYGAVTGKSSVTISYAGHVNYIAPTTLTLDGICGAPVVSLNHYRLEYDANALTCQSQGVTIKACADASCSSLLTSQSSVQLDVITALPSQYSSHLTFTGSTQVTIAESVPTTVALALSQSDPNASYQCYQNGELDAFCDYQLADTGFIFLNDTEVNPANRLRFPTQIAGKPSDVGYNRISMALQAVQTDTATGACTALFAQSAVVPVNLAYSCVDPNQCSVNVAAITNNNSTSNLTQYSQYTAVNLQFGADAKAFIALTYPDVGKIKLHAQKSVVLNPDVGSSSTTVLTGSSEDITVRPFALRVNVDGDAFATDASGSVLGKAGEGFTTTIAALQWLDGQDNDFDGVPDGGVDLSANAVTPNFGQEVTAEAVSLSSSIVSPIGGSDPGIVNGSFNQFVLGSQTKSGDAAPSWSEVGVINLTAETDNSYLDTNDKVSGYLANVGRFVPDHFNVARKDFIQGCSSVTYMAQADLLDLSIEAQSKTNGVLLNYSSGAGNDFHADGFVSVHAENNNDGVDLSGRLSAINGSWVAGKYEVSANLIFNRLTAAKADGLWMDGPFDFTQLSVAVDDGVAGVDIALNGVDVNFANSVDCVALGNCNAVSINAAPVKYRYGRLAVQSAFGPSDNPLQIPISTEYWDGSGFALSTLDNCSRLVPRDFTISGVNAGSFDNAFEVADLSSNNAIGTSSIALNPPNSTSTLLTADDGSFNLTFNSPTFNSVNSFNGYIPVIIDVSTYPWLQFDWDGNGRNAIANSDKILPVMRVTFGQYRGNDRVIYWREKR